MQNPIWIGEIEFTHYVDGRLHIHMRGTYDHYDREYSWMSKTFTPEQAAALLEYLKVYVPTQKKSKPKKPKTTLK